MKLRFPDLSYLGTFRLNWAHATVSGCRWAQIGVRQKQRSPGSSLNPESDGYQAVEVLFDKPRIREITKDIADTSVST